MPPAVLERLAATVALFGIVMFERVRVRKCWADEGLEEEDDGGAAVDWGGGAPAAVGVGGAILVA